jgi:hypothetical protein
MLFVGEFCFLKHGIDTMKILRYKDGGSRTLSFNATNNRTTTGHDPGAPLSPHKLTDL